MNRNGYDRMDTGAKQNGQIICLFFVAFFIV